MSNLENIRQQYAKIRAGLQDVKLGTAAAAIDALVAKTLPEDPKPADWLKGIKSVRVVCGRCAGTGQFVTYVENGKAKGPGGVCFRCAGRGAQSIADVRRNAYYDEHGILDRVMP